MTAEKNSAFSWPYGWFASGGIAAKRSATKATRLATTFTTLSSASEYKAALPVIHHAAAFIASTMMPTAMVPIAMRCTRSTAPVPYAGGM